MDLLDVMEDLFSKLQEWPTAIVLVPAALVLLWLTIGGLRPAVSPKSSTGKTVGSKGPHTSYETQSAKSTASDNEFCSMGSITPFDTSNWISIPPKKIYKFKPKYFLTMGLQNTDVNEITQLDAQYLSRLSERERILDAQPTALACLPSAVPMVNELYRFLVTAYLPTRYPEIFVPSANGTLSNKLTGLSLPVSPSSNPLTALRFLALNLDDDFIMLLPSPDGDGYTLQAYIWCYPAGFEPGEKLGMKLRDIHGPVPGYKEKLESSMDRYFAKLEVGQVVQRRNWSVAHTPVLWQSTNLHVYSPDDISTQVPLSDHSSAFLRCELQTLFALPSSGARIMALHLYMYPLQQVKDEGVGPEMADAIEGLKKGNAERMWMYKGAIRWGEGVVSFLRS